MTRVDHLVQLASAALAGGLEQGQLDEDQSDWKHGETHIANRALNIAYQTYALIVNEEYFFQKRLSNGQSTI